MGTRTNNGRNRAKPRGLATFVAFLLLFAFAIGQSSLTALANDDSTDPVAEETASDDGGSGSLPEATPEDEAPAEEAPAEEAPAEEAPAEEPAEEEAPPAEEPAEEAPAVDDGASSGGGKASASADDGSTSGKRSKLNAARAGDVVIQSHGGLHGGDVSLDYVAAGPFTYDHATGVGTYPTFGFNDRTIDKDDGVVESLESGDFACGDHVTFFTQIEIEDGADGPGTVELHQTWGMEPTGQAGLGFNNIVSVAINTPDDGNVGNVSDNVVTLEDEFTETQGYDQLHGIISVTNLAPGETAILRVVVILACGAGSPTGNILNDIDSATADGQNVSVGQQTVPMKVTGFVAEPAIDIEKTCPASVPFGEEVVFEFTLVNNGNEPLTDVEVLDPLLGGDITDEFNLPGGLPDPLPVGDTVYTASVSYLPGDDEDPVENAVTVNANGSISDTFVTDSAACDTDITHEPGIEVTKTCPLSVPFGEEITFEFTLENTGNEPLDDVMVTDALLGGDITSEFNLPDPLPVGDTVYTASINYLPGANEDPVINEVSASAVGVDSGDPANSSDDCSTDVTHEPDIEVTKSCAAFAHAGDTVTYTITVTNTGNIALTNITVMDSILGDLSASFPDDLAVDGSATATVEYVIPEDASGSVVNVVTASGTQVNTETTVSDVAECTTELINPAIDIVKTVSEDTVPVGTTVTYTYVITNTGDTTLYDVSVDDDILGHIGDIPVLEPGPENAVTMTKDFVVGEDPVTNVATAEGEDILGRSVSASDDALVTPILAENPPPPTPFTGSDAARLGIIAMVLFGIGATLVAATRRRRARETA